MSCLVRVKHFDARDFSRSFLRQMNLGETSRKVIKVAQK